VPSSQCSLHFTGEWQFTSVKANPGSQSVKLWGPALALKAAIFQKQTVGEYDYQSF